MKIYILLGVAFLYLQTPAVCSAVPKDGWQSAADIQGLSGVLDTLQKTAKIPVLFPKVIINQQKETYFATLLPGVSGYQIVISSSGQKCTNCTCQYVGWMRVSKGSHAGFSYGSTQPGGKPTEIKKTKVKLGNKTAYYTPHFYTKRGEFPPQITWVEGYVFYTLLWRGATKEELIKMATSAIEASRK